MIGLVRRFTKEFYGHLYDELLPPLAQHDGWTSQVSLAAHELVENAVRHGLDGDVVFSLNVEVDPDQTRRAHTVCVQTRNRASAIQHEFVRQRLQELRRAEDMFAFYVGLMTQSAGNDGSGLGLARIWVEAQMELDCAVHGDELEIRAQARVSVSAGSGPHRPTMGGIKAL